MKRCCQCRRTLALELFGSDRHRRDGRNNRCRSCDSRRSADYYERRGRGLRGTRGRRDRERSESSVALRERRARNARQWRQDNPLAARLRERRRSAKFQRATVTSAVREGEPWTAADDILVRNADTRALEVALILGRSYRAVEARRRKLRGNGGRPSLYDRRRAEGFVASGKRWTAADDAVVSRIDLRIPEMALILGRTLSAVSRRRDKLRKAGWQIATPPRASRESRPRPTCVGCGLPVGKGRRRYCGVACADEGERRCEAGYNARRQRSQWARSARVCRHERCGAEFSPANPGQVYCDRICRRRASRRRERVAGTRR